VDSPVPWQYPQKFSLKPVEKQGRTEEYLSALLGAQTILTHNSKFKK